jgi:hypothetical protein
VSLLFEKVIPCGAQRRRIVRDDGAQAERGRAPESGRMINRSDDCLQPAGARGFAGRAVNRREFHLER